MSFMDRFAASSNVFTHAEILRIISSYALPLSVKDIEITEDHYPAHTHGTMNFALDCVFSQISSEKSLRVSFVADENRTEYAEDMARFLASELQIHYPSYHCIGVLV
jgi:hypothetical protein